MRKINFGIVCGFFFVGVCSSSLLAQTYGKNLVVNGDAESGPGTTGSAPPASIPGWTISGSPNVILYSANDRLSNASVGPASRGKNYFAGSNTAQATLTQTIDVSSAASGIDAGTVSYDASGYIGGSSGDTSQMIVTLKNASGGTITSFTFGPLTDSDKAQDDALYLRRKIGQMPSGTRSVTVEVDLIRSSGSSNDGCADNISFILNNDAAPASGFFGSNIIVNGNAEAPNGVDLNNGQFSGFALDIPGWVRSADFSLDGYPYDDDLSPTDPGPADRGSWYFYGGNGNPTSNAYQDIDVAGAATQIDTGKVTFNFAGWVGGIAGQGDNMTVTAQFMNWAGAVLATSTLNPASDADRNGQDALIQRTQSGGVPTGTRMIRVTMTSVRTDGADDDGLADSLSLVLTAPASGGTTPAITLAVSASAFGDFPTIAPGTWVEIYGSNLATDSRQWAGSDFTGSTAPTSLDGTTVKIGGLNAFINYISATQVNAQIPSGVAPGPQQITVSVGSATSAAYPITVNALQPGLLAPVANFQIGGKQYVVALHGDGTYVLPPGAIPGLTTRQAQPGETILLYGIGFGTVNPAFNAGQIVGAQNQLTQPLSILFAGAAANVQYDGLAPNYVGLYQFNVVVPNVSDSDTVPLTFTLGGQQGSQTLYTAVKRQQ